ncbi:hypothetical protein J4856_10675 [Prevotella scopos JCM 17725]|mgnify:FL=1|uniref:Uncharacterized protein n=1 Tax=Prevotella scopos JCM 17725 TaxID=1236518 RepID=A0AAX2F5G0_9BACT|nr:hypothetical protein [Prevotella scopos]ANR72579.1 hypothetical protein AXF22_03655 [Prevotella scopos JCM 17725]QUB45209.1 hypothetical protein J4856_10675 [Prevotella scopos JCM 17725]SHF97053.1 hypothetical protein SAMN05444364_12225 [Prevotella scopos JCM 17725]
MTLDFPIIDLKRLYAGLHECYGFDYSELSEEFSLILQQHYPFKHEAEILAKATTEEGKVDIQKFALETNDCVAIPITTEFAKQVKDFYSIFSSVFIPELDGSAIYYEALCLMAAIYYRDKHHLFSEIHEDIMNDYFVYSRRIRPDQLKLFIELCKGRKRTWDNIKISVGNNSPVFLGNYEWWLSQKLFEILRKDLGDITVEKAEKELKELYSDERGRKSTDPHLNYFMLGSFLYIRKFLIQDKDKVTIAQCNFLQKYLTTFGILDKQDKNYQINNLQSTIKSLLSGKNNPIQKHIKEREYRCNFDIIK